VFSILALARPVSMPATLNLIIPDAAGCPVDLVPITRAKRTLKHVLFQCFGFGGVNASLVFSACASASLIVQDWEK